ncbi:MAG: DUF1559 domain-containing protein, partial [Gemmataceae bacterium]|nr:DUF1559 domain-containing protein [Gemmataceae bacterium]
MICSTRREQRKPMLLRRTPPGHGLTRVELGVVVVILGLTLCFLAVFLLRQRERALRAQCVNHLRRLGQAVHAYH